MNENIINKFIELIASWGAIAQIFGFLILLSSLGFFFFEKFRNAIIDTIYHLLRWSSDNPIKHPFFLQKALYFLQIDRIDFKEKHKNWLFKKILKIKFSTSFNIIQEFINSKEWKKQNKYELQATLLLLLQNIVKSYENEILKAFLIKYPKHGKELFDIVYFGEIGFKKYHQQNIDFIQQNISKIFMVNSYNDNEKINSFILQIWVALDSAINDCFFAFEFFNGNYHTLIEKIDKDV